MVKYIFKSNLEIRATCKYIRHAEGLPDVDAT